MIRAAFFSQLNTSDCRPDSTGAAAGETGGEDDESSSQGRPQDQGPEPQRGPRGADLQVGETKTEDTALFMRVRSQCVLLLVDVTVSAAF